MPVSALHENRRNFAALGLGTDLIRWLSREVVGAREMVVKPPLMLLLTHQFDFERLTTMRYNIKRTNLKV